MARISSQNQITLPVAAPAEAALQAGDEVVVDVVDDGQLLVRRGSPQLASAFCALTGVYPVDYLAQPDAEDAER